MMLHFLRSKKFFNISSGHFSYFYYPFIFPNFACMSEIVYRDSNLLLVDDHPRFKGRKGASKNQDIYEQGQAFQRCRR